MGEHFRPKKNKTFTKEIDVSDLDSKIKRIQFQLESMERKIAFLFRQSGTRDDKATTSSKSHRENDTSKRTFGQKNIKIKGSGLKKISKKSITGKKKKSSKK